MFRNHFRFAVNVPAHALVCVCVSKTGFKLCTFLLLVDFGRLVNFRPNVYNASCTRRKGFIADFHKIYRSILVTPL